VRSRLLISVLIVLLLAGGTIYVVRARDSDRDAAASLDLARAVTIEGIREHLRALQRIADNNGGTRYAGSPGFDASVDYAADRLEDAGFEVDLQGFEIPVFQEASPPELVRVEPSRTRFEENKDFVTLLYSGSGIVTAPVVPVDLDPGAPRTQVDSGCRVSAFGDFPEGSVALVQRSRCFYRDQAQSAETGGAAGMIVIQEEAGGRGVLAGTLLSDSDIDIPVVAVSPAVGQQLSRAGTRIRVQVDGAIEDRVTNNIVAEIGSGDEVLMVGGHLDSVPGGPGINDNGSGVAMLLEIAEEYAAAGRDERLRFAFWSAEEYGLLGSTEYVARLDEDQLEAITAYLNFDMVGSPNFVRFVYDGSGDPDDAVIQRSFESYFRSHGLETDLIPLEGRSDHAAFESSGVPVGGLFSGAENIKTRDQADVFGGRAGEPTDPCYHLLCDNLDNVNLDVVDQMADAAAHAIVSLLAVS
jgi:Zn-dependent M28 family amino/carboxypeptidase